MIDIWEDLAGRLGKATDFVKMPTFVKLMETLPAGTADVALGPLAITEAREKQFDLTHPIFHSGLRIAVRPGSVSENLLKTPPLAGRVKLVGLSALDKGPELLLQGKADGVLADEQQLDYVLEQTPPEQRSRLRLALKGAYRESQAFAYSPNLDNEIATRLDRAISQAKRDGLLP
jgi:ABC-type amino acid transport substrate-binding protein